MISMIWAMDEDNLIGSNNAMPWHVKEDLLYYKEKTKNEVVVMGFKTYESLKGYYTKRPFPYKKTYVLTHRTIEDEKVETISSIEEIMNKEKDFFVVGGKNVYFQFMPYADRLYISYIKGHHEGDTYMKPLDLSLFNLVSLTETEVCKYTIYERKK